MVVGDTLSGSMPARSPVSEQATHDDASGCERIGVLGPHRRHLGMEVQGVGLARAIGIEPIVETIRPNPRCGSCPAWPHPSCRSGGQRGRSAHPAMARPGDLLRAPDRRRIDRDPRPLPPKELVHIQDPRISPSAFDVLVVSDHDPAKGPGDPDRRGSEPAYQGGCMKLLGNGSASPHLPPRVAVNIGGSNKRYDFSEAQVERFAQALNEMAERDGAGLIIATSRRTDARTKDILARVLTGPNVWLWRGPDDGPNPYPGCLGLADAIVVTSDSVNMVSEACWTGKPVLVSAIEPESGRLARFHEQLRARHDPRIPGQA